MHSQKLHHMSLLIIINNLWTKTCCFNCFLMLSS